MDNRFINQKKAIIFQSDGGELGNQLWNYISVYAYALEKGRTCENYSFFEYASFFSDLRPQSFFVRSLFFNEINTVKKRRNAWKSRFWRNLYKILVVMPHRLFFKKRIISSSEVAGKICYYLAPTQPSAGRLAKLEQDSQTSYFAIVSGGVFRNPMGIQKYHQAIKKHFEPNERIRQSVQTFITPLRMAHKHLIGVHIRQSDYKDFKGGKYFVSQERVSEILRQYLHEKGIQSQETAFVIASDGAIDEAVFEGLNIIPTQKSMVEDLFILASTDTIIGSDSTFGHFAAYYGGIPHIVVKNEAIDWQYYRSIKGYAPNKYLTVMAY
jgi:hypothetical protein